MPTTPFEVLHENDGVFFVEAERHQLTAEQAAALDRAEAAGLLAAQRADVQSGYLRRYEIPIGVVPITALSADITAAYEDEIFDSLKRGEQISGIESEQLRMHLVHMNFATEGDAPIRLLPTFVSGMQRFRAIGGLATNS